MSDNNEIYEEEEYDDEEIGKRLNIIMATSSDMIAKLYTSIATFVGELPKIGSLKTTDQWDMLEAFTMRVPKRLASLLRIYNQANNRLDRLDIQLKKIRFELQLTAQENFGKSRQLQPKDKEIAILNDERYEQALIQYNIQKNLVDYLDKTIDQYKFLNNSANTRVEIAKLRKDLGF